MSNHTPLTIGLVLFPGLTLLDLAGPFEVLARLPGAKLYLLAPQLEPVRSDRGLVVMPDTRFEDAPGLDVLFVPGGPGQVGVMEDARYLDFLRAKAEVARYVTSVCTGSLVLGAAGLLHGYRATTHWRCLDLLSLLGAQPVAERVVIDGNRVTAAGVSAGIDLGLALAAQTAGEEVAQQIQLMIEYDPRPLFSSGSPASADPALTSSVSASLNGLYKQRRTQIERIVVSFSLPR
jgi:cyclohexyl-isocyanide hydratase